MGQVLDPTFVATVNLRAYSALQTPRRNAGNTAYEFGTAGWLDQAQTWAAQQTFSTAAPIFSTMTAGSVLFAGTSGVLAQDNASLFFDDANNRLGVGTSSPAARLAIKTADSTYTGGLHFTKSSGANTWGWVYGSDDGLYFGYAADGTAAGNFANKFHLDTTGAGHFDTTLTSGALLSLRANFAGSVGNYAGVRFGDVTQTTDYQKGALIYEGLSSAARGRFHIALNNDETSSSAVLADARLTVESNGQTLIALAAAAAQGLQIRGTTSQSAVILQLQGQSSTTAGRQQADIDTAWIDSTDATRKARLILRAWDTAAREAARGWADGTVGRFAAAAPASAPTDAHIAASQVSFYLDESGHNLLFRVCYADGSTYKTGTVALV